MALPVDTASVETLADFSSPAKRWKMELQIARKPHDKWAERVKKIIRRYMDERMGTTEQSARRFNILWSNVQTLMPAIYARTPKPVVERRYLDRDQVGRVASMIAERALSYEMETGYFHPAIQQAVLDYLLGGRGTVWVRYEPTYSHASDKLTDVDAIEDMGEGSEGSEGGNDDGQESAAGDDGSNPQGGETDGDTEEGDDNDGDADVEVTTEKLCIDYVNWNDFLIPPARTWEEVTWVAKKAHLTRDELCDKFGKEQGDTIPLDHVPAEIEKDANAPGAVAFKKATIWEIWDKTTRKVYFVSEQYEGECLGEPDGYDDPLKLAGFWPCPKPLLATTSNESLIPVPDYAEYQDQAEQLDELTARINKLQEAIKAIGVYDASVPELRRLFEEGEENKLYPVDSWAAFAEKGGTAGAVSLLPIKELAEVLGKLYESRQQAKQDLYEITGISDIVRGQSNANETATAQNIKSNFATLRLDSRKADVANFCRDTIRIMGEMVAEHFSPKTLYEVSGYEQYAKEQFAPDVQGAPQQAPQTPQMGHNGGPPLNQPAMPPQGMMAPQPMQPSPEQLAALKASDTFDKAVALLRDEKQRGFRIEIETDSTVEPNRSQEKRDRTEFLTAATRFIAQAEQIAMMDPTIVPVLGKMLLFGVRAFPTARDLETSFEEWIAKAEQKATQPRPPKPDPEMIKAQTEQQRTQMDMQIAQQKAQLEAQTVGAKLQADQQSAEHDLQIKRQIAEIDLQMKQIDLQIKMKELEMKGQAMAMDHQAKAADMAMKSQQMGMESEASQREHALGLEMMAEKARQAEPEALA